MNFNKDLFFRTLKKEAFDEAASVSLPIKDNFGLTIGWLIPVGNWIFDTPEIINSMVGWRVRFNRMFPTQSNVSYKTTVDYLNKSSIENETSILFLIYDNERRCVGHIGIAHIDRDPFELVNLMRGLGGGHPKLSFFAEVALLDYCFKNTKSESSNVEVMSFNWMAISLHEEVGYSIVQSYPLRKIENELGIRHEIVSQLNSNVNYFVQNYLLNRAYFYKNIKFSS